MVGSGTVTMVPVFGAPHLNRVTDACDGAVAERVVEHHAPRGDSFGPIGRGRRRRQRWSEVVAELQCACVGFDGLAAQSKS